MGDLRTVLTYNRSSDAEVDKAFLESRGIDVFLLNGETAPSELGAPFNIQLQVSQRDFEAAWNALRETNPGRFGSPHVVDEIDRVVTRAALFFCAAAVPAGLIAYWLIPQAKGWPMPQWGIWPKLYGSQIIPDLRIFAALLIAILAGIGSATVAGKKSLPD